MICYSSLVLYLCDSSLFCCTVLLGGVIDIFCWSSLDSFLVLTCLLECFTVYFSSITLQFLVFELQGDSCLEDLSIAASKSTREGLLLPILVLAGVSSLQNIREKFFLLLNSVSVKLSLNGAMLFGNFSFGVDAAKSSFITSLLFGVSVVLITLFSDVLQLFIEVVDKLFESSSVIWL